MKGLSYYYSLSPLMWLNFLFIKIGETVGIFNPTTIHYYNIITFCSTNMITACQLSLYFILLGHFMDSWIGRYFQQRKIGIFIVAIALTLFSNFYFSYYQAIIMVATIYIDSFSLTNMTLSLEHKINLRHICYSIECIIKCIWFIHWHFCVLEMTESKIPMLIYHFDTT